MSHQDVRQLTPIKTRLAAKRVQPTCAECQISFQTSQELEKHASETKHKAWVCQVCSVRFCNRPAFSRHKNQHNDPGKHQCLNCGQCFRRKHILLKHETLHKQGHSSALVLASGDEDPDDGFPSRFALVATEPRSPKNLDSLLVEAVSKRKWHETSYLIGRGANPFVHVKGFHDEECQRYGRYSRCCECRWWSKSMLTIFAQSGELELVRLLLLLGTRPHTSDLNDPSKSIDWPLVSAASNGHMEVVSTLLGHPTNMDGEGWLACYDEYDIEPLYMPCTPLIAALRNGHEDIALKLLNAGSNATIATYSMERHENIVKFSPLALAAQNGNIAVVRFLLAQGASFHEVASDCRDPGCKGTPLFFAAMYGHVRVVELLLGLGAIFTITGEISAFQYGATIPNTNDNIDTIACTPLFVACMKGHASVVALLLDHGAVIDTRACHEGLICGTPLFVAAANGCTEVLEILLDRGAQKSTEGCLGWHCGMWAYGAPLLGAIQNCRLDTVRFLVESGAAIDTPACRFGDQKHVGTSLHIAAAMVIMGDDHLELTEFLIENGADMKAKGFFSMWNDCLAQGTAMMIAASEGHGTMVELMIDHGASPNERAIITPEHSVDPTVHPAAFTTTALIVATTKASWLLSFKAVEILLQKGADPNIWGTVKADLIN